MEIFARLEVVADRQILAEIVNGDDGPKVRLRRDHEITVEVTHGPWPDTDDGWEKAEAFLGDLDLVRQAAEIDRQVAKFTNTAFQHG